MLLPLHDIQKALDKFSLEGWLIFDYRHSNPLACRVLKIAPSQMLTRRFFYWIPREGTPVKLVSSVENPLTSLSGHEVVFHSWQELRSQLKTLCGDGKKIAMEYSPRGEIPDISFVDAGTLEMVKSLGAQVVSSGDLIQMLLCVWNEHKWKLHNEAAELLEETVELAWRFIESKLNSHTTVTEYEVQQMMKLHIESAGGKADHPPICAVNANSSDPHYVPQADSSQTIKPGDWVLLDLWCKLHHPEGVYADITRVGLAGGMPSEKQQEVFSLVREAQRQGVEFVRKKYQHHEPIKGFEVDDVCRDWITKAGYGPFFLHRTGHNIDLSDHGPGAHLDNLETHDTRTLLPSTCCSVEPGIYLPGDFGVRLEFDIFLHPSGEVVITGGEQNEIKILKVEV